MGSETLVHRHPPTPPNISVALPSSLQTAAQSIPEPDYPYEDSQTHEPNSSSPVQTVYDGFSRYSPPIDGYHTVPIGLGLQYEEYRQAPGCYQEGQYSGLVNNPAVFSGSPPTPRSATEYDDSGRRTRSGRTIAPSSSPPQEEKARPKLTPKSRKSKSGKSEKPKTPKLTTPLSILTKDMNSIPVRNMEEWVNRSVEVRRKEVEKRNGYVTRPMNSFMLYRSAYAERTKQWCLQNNHQVVSSVSGESWPMEPPEIRELYNEYAKIERINHQNAHPNYKFSPSKGSTPSRKRKGDFSEEEPSDLEDAEWSPGHGRPRSWHPRRPERTLSYPANGMNIENLPGDYIANVAALNKSTWEMTEDGRPVPVPMGQEDLYNQYYLTSMHPNMGMAVATMDDLRFRRVDTPNSTIQFSPDHALLGLPGGNAVDFMRPIHSYPGTPLGGEAQVDPMLLAYDGGHHTDVGPAPVQPPDFRSGHMGIVDRELEQHGIHGLVQGMPGQEEFRSDPWQPDPNMGAMEQESEFEKWMDH